MKKKTNHSRQESQINVAFMRLLLVILRTAVLVTATLATAQADDRRSHRERREHHNYILERQSAGQVSGVPIMQRIRGSRKIDIYSDGSMFEKNNYVGSAKR